MKPEEIEIIRAKGKLGTMIALYEKKTNEFLGELWLLPEQKEVTDEQVIRVYLEWRNKEEIEKADDKKHGPKLEEYDDIAKEAEPLPTKYYKWKNSGEEKEFKFVLQRHWPTGRKEEIKPGEKVPEMHKGLGILEEVPNELVTWLENSSLKKELYRIMKIRDHLDLRMEISKDKLIGVTIHPPVPEGITTWESFKDRMNVGDKTQVTPKYEHPHGWLSEEGELRFPTRHTAPGEKEQVAHYIEIAEMEIIDKGTVKFGVQRKDAHEYFFYGKQLKGRWVIRRLTIGIKYPHEAWLLMKPEDQRPMDSSYHKDTGYYKIDWIKAPTTEEREAIEQEVARARLERKQKGDYDFVLHKHYGEDISTHFDLRWKISNTHKKEFNLYGDPRTMKEAQEIRARFKDIEESAETLKLWMVNEGEHLERHVRGVDTPTYIDVEDFGKLKVIDELPDRIAFTVDSKELKGDFIYLRKPKARIIKLKPGELSKIKKDEDWCVNAGGSWITYEGRHICIGKETDDPDRPGYKVASVIHDEYNKTRVHYKENIVPDIVNGIKSGLQYYPVKVRADINDVWIHDSTLNDAVVGANFWYTGLIEVSDVKYVDPVGNFHHEVGHSIWNRQFKLPQHLDWGLVEGKPITWYGGRNSQEDFCESLKYYKTKPELLKEKAPQRYELIKKQMEDLSK